MRLRLPLALGLAAFALVGCVTVQLGPPPPPEVTRLDTSGAPAGAPMAQAVNAFRAQNGRPPLRENRRLVAAAQAYARVQHSTGGISHVGPNGSRVSDRIRAQGYDACFWAENLAKGQGSVPEVVQDWIESPGHRRNLLSQASEFGYGRYGDTWVIVFGTRCDR